MFLGQASKQLAPVWPARDFERVIQQDDIDEMQAALQLNLLLRLVQLTVHLHAKLCGKATCINSSAHAGCLKSACGTVKAQQVLRSALK